MAQLLQTTEYGYSIYSPGIGQFDTLITHYDPSGSYLDAAPVHSICYDLQNFVTYKKASSGSGVNKWDRVYDFLREPVKAVATNEATSLPGLTTILNSNVGVIDGIDCSNFVAGDRILFAHAQNSAELILTVVGVPGSGASFDTYGSDAVFICGHMVFVSNVLNSNHANQFWVYDGLHWIPITRILDSRFENIETLIGDTNSGLVHDVNDLDNRVDNLETTVGDVNSGLVEDVNDLQSRMTSVENADLDLLIHSENVSSVQVIDIVDCSKIASCTWKVRARQANSSEYQEVISWHDGTSTSPPTSSSYFVVNSGVIGSRISGYDLTVDIYGSSPYLLRLKATSTANVNILATRYAIPIPTGL